MAWALVCDWLTGMRGGERCFEVACELWPEADVFTLVHRRGAVSAAIEAHRIHTSVLQSLPGADRWFRLALPWFSGLMGRFDLSRYEGVVSFSHCVAAHVRVPPGVPHLCYCHTPMRYAWDQRGVYLRSVPRTVRPVLNRLLDRLQRQDRRASCRVTRFVANSRHVRERIRRAYGRPADVLPPPVNLDRFTVGTGDDGRYLVVSALVPYKRIDRAIEAFRGTGRRLDIIGRGPAERRLRRLAGPEVRFLGALDDASVARRLQRCRALVFPGVEDFGIVPLEAQACGKPVIALAAGGALETVRAVDHPTDPVEAAQATGVFFHCPTAAALRAAVERFERLTVPIRPEVCRRQAERFSRDRFAAGLQALVGEMTAPASAATGQAASASSSELSSSSRMP